MDDVLFATSLAENYAAVRRGARSSTAVTRANGTTVTPQLRLTSPTNAQFTVGQPDGPALIMCHR
jgi:hypothetical protein